MGPKWPWEMAEKWAPGPESTQLPLEKGVMSQPLASLSLA